MLNDGACVVGPTLFNEHADGVLGKNLTNCGMQRLKPALIKRKACQELNERFAAYGARCSSSHELIKPDELGFVIGVNCKPETTEKREVLIDGRKITIGWSVNLFALAFRGGGLHSANQMRRVLVGASLHRHGVHDFRSALQGAIEELPQLKGLQFGAEGSRYVRPAVFRPQTGSAHHLKKRRLANRRMDQRFEPHQRFAFLWQGLVDAPKIAGETARRLALVLISLRKSLRLDRERQNALREAVHWFLESLVGAGVSVIAAGRRDKGAPGTIHDRTGASSASGSVSQNLRVKDR